MLRARVSESAVKALLGRATRLSALIERATQRSAERYIREGGAQLIDLLNERIEEIRELQASDDDELSDKLRGLELRLSLAEQKVVTWPSAKAKERPERPTPKGRRPKGRGQSDKRPVKTAA